MVPTQAQIRPKAFATPQYMTPEGNALKEAYQWEARAQWKGKPLEGDVELKIALYFGTKRKGWRGQLP
jgi:Holliday junction resolvase RusA-like endonuclease